MFIVADKLGLAATTINESSLAIPEQQQNLCCMRFSIQRAAGTITNFVSQVANMNPGLHYPVDR